MALDKEKCSRLKTKLEGLIAELGKDSKKCCFESGRLQKLDDSRKKFIDEFEEAQKEGRKLRIGIIGSVKAGKSSFLNTLFFNGKERLPKAATPMTAALTIISYSETPGAVIHYYDKDTWKGISKSAKEYDEKLDKAYKEYLIEYKKADEEPIHSRPAQRHPKLDKETFEKHLFHSSVDPKLSTSKELYSMAEQKCGVNSDKIGTIERVSENELNNYIGADGRYTPIVNYVELSISDKEIDGVEIIDTPGLNDPIVSRSETTLSYLSKVDVAILLSPTSQFMDASTFNLMIQGFPANGIKNIIVVGSKIDSGMLDYKDSGVSIRKVYTITVNKCKEHLDNIVGDFSPSYPKECSQINDSPVLFISSILGCIAYKKKKGEPLNEEEKHIYQLLKKRFTEFDDTHLYALSGFKSIKTELNKIQQKKEEIINQRNSELYQRYKRDCTVNLREIRDDAFHALERLEHTDIKELTKKKDAIISTLESVRSNLRHICTIEANNAVKIAERLKANLNIKTASDDHSLEIHEETKHRTSTSGFWIFEKTAHWDEHIKYVRTAEAHSKIRGYIGSINISTLDQFGTIIQTDVIEKKAREIIIPAMKNYDGSTHYENEVIFPLQETISKLSIVRMQISPDKYINNIKAAYKTDKAEGDDVHKFMALFNDILGQITDEAIKYIDEQISKIEDILPGCMDGFIDTLSKKFDGQIKQLEQDMKSKQESIERYKAFMLFIDQNINELK